MVTPTRFYLCTLTFTCRQLHALVALSSAFVSDIFVPILQCALHWLQLNKCFSLLISLRNQQAFFFNFILSVGSQQKLPQHSILSTYSLLVFFFLVWRSFDPGLTSNPAHIFCIRLLLTLLVILIFCVSHSNLQFDFCFNPAIPFSIWSFFRPTVATNSYSSWDECLSNLWTLPTFSEISNMSRDDLTTPVDTAATAQVKLCPYDEEEAHIWFHLIEAQFAAAGIKS